VSGPDILPTLEARGLLTPDEAAQVREAAAERGVSALDALRSLALADDREVSKALAEAYGLEWIGEIRTAEVPAA